VNHDLFVMQIPILEKIIRTVLVYAVIVVLFRLTGKRGLAGLNTFDFIVIFLLSNVVQNAIIGNDDSLLGGVVGAVTLIAVNTGLNRTIAMSDTADRWLQGKASVVIEDGTVDRRMVRRLGLRPRELNFAVRLQNGDSIDDVQSGQLEPSGQLVISLKDSEQAMTRGDMQVLVERLDSIEAHLVG
jgi:uncharacterized membrane protein YcaP (DUF421 family)